MGLARAIDIYNIKNNIYIDMKDIVIIIIVIIIICT